MSNEPHISLKIPSTRLSKEIEGVCLSLLDASLQASISILNEKLEYQYFNENAYRLFKLSPNDLKLGDTHERCTKLLFENGLLTPEIIKKNKLSPSSEVVKRGRKLFTRILEFADGRRIRYSRTTLENGYIVSVSYDVSEYLDKDNLLEDALRLGRSGYWILDLKTGRTMLSKTLEQHCGPKIAAMLRDKGTNCLSVEEDRHLLPEALKAAMRGDGKFTVIGRTRGQGGEIRRGMTTGEILRDENGKPVKVRAFVKDITEEYEQSRELEAAKDAAVKASHAKSEFLANMSHEIRTPMNGVLGMAELLSDSNLDQRQQECVKVISNSAQSLLTIINDILDFSKIEAGALSMDPVPFNLGEVVDNVEALLQQAASKKGLDLIVNYKSELPRQFIGDGGRIKQVLNNLVGNAVKFTEKGTVTIDIDVVPLRANLQIVKITVRDTGIGISPDKLGDIFNKFTQAEGGTTRLYGGTGLGLSITKCIVEMMNGRIKAASTIGQGSIFTCAIPLSVDVDTAVLLVNDNLKITGDAKPIKTLEKLTAANEKINVLVAEDFALNQDVVKLMLSDTSFSPVFANNGQIAVDMFTAEPDKFSAILMDISMPIKDGYQAAQEILAFEAETGRAHTPIIALTGHALKHDREKCLDYGMDEYLSKPVKQSALLKTLTECLEMSMPQSAVA